MTDPSHPRPSFLQVFGSVLAAIFGVQSEENRRRDFQYGSPWQFIWVGLIGAILFVLLVYGIVQLVVPRVSS